MYLALLQPFTVGLYTKAMFCLRSLTDAAGASPSKYSRQYVCIPVESGQAVSFPRERVDGLDRMIHSGLKVFRVTLNTLVLQSDALHFEMGSFKALLSWRSVQLVKDEL